MSRAGENDFDCVRGDTFTRRLTYRDSSGAAIDVSSWTFAGQVRTDPDAADPALADFAFDTTAAADGVVDISLAADDTAEFTGSFLYYDIQATNGDVVTTAPRGRLRIIKDVTR